MLRSSARTGGPLTEGVLVATSTTWSIRTATALAAAPLVLGVALTGTAEARPRADREPVQKATTTCTGPSEDAEFGGALVELKLRKNIIPADDFYVAVPVDDATGLDAGPRTAIEADQRRATAFVPADGTSLTPSTTLEIRFGGEVLQRIAVRAGCGVLDPDPQAGPLIGAITVEAGTVTVPVVNGSSITDEIGVTLFPVGGSTGDSRFLTLAPGAGGTVTFTGVAPGQYTVEAFGYTTFVSAETAPFVVG